jgi:hypothetical protein
VNEDRGWFLEGEPHYLIAVGVQEVENNDLIEALHIGIIVDILGGAYTYIFRDDIKNNILIDAKNVKTWVGTSCKDHQL